METVSLTADIDFKIQRTDKTKQNKTPISKVHVTQKQLQVQHKLTNTLSSPPLHECL